MPGVVVKFDALPIRPPVNVVEVVEDAVFCPCDFRCDFEEKVFAHADADGIKNDITDFLFKKVTATDTIVIQITRDNVILATISNNDYGTYYNGFANQPLYVGWLADWTKIFNQFSGGRFQIKVTTTILGESTVFRSRYFRLQPYDIFEANETVKIRTFQNGRLENNEFDFTNLIPGGWPTSIKLSGSFGQMQPNLERDIFQDSSYREVQNRDTVQREYKLKANFVPESIHNRIATTDVLANEIFITTYGLLKELQYENYPVVPESFSDTKYDDLGRTYFEIIFSDRQKNIIKTNT